MKSLLICLLFFTFQLYSNQTAFVTCSGKCGGMTLAYSFVELGFDVAHWHTIDDNRRDYILDKSRSEPVLIIDSIREPIARKISGYFENLLFHLNMSPDEIMERYNKDRFGFVDYLIKDCTKSVISTTAYEDYTFYHWYKLAYDCLIEGFFDYDNHYQLINIGNLYFVNLRFKDIANWREIIRSLPIPIDLSHFEIVTRNRAKDKFLRDIYADFLERVNISRHHFNAIMRRNERELAHFHTEEEIEEFKRKWEPNIKD